MAVTIKWTAPTGSNWTHSRVYSSSSKNGTYALVATIAIGTYSYLHSTGSSSLWYKVSYWDGTNESSLSDFLQGDQSSSYVSLDKFRTITNFAAEMITDNDVLDLGIEASRFIQKKVCTKVKLERQLKGAIDGTNTYMYSKFKPIADIDFDADVDGDDVSVFYATFDTQNVINYGSAQTVSTVDARAGRFTMSTAPTTTTAEAGVYLTYSHTIEDIDYDLLKLAATYLCAYLAALKIKGEAPNYAAISAPFLRTGVSTLTRQDIYKYGYLKQYTLLMQELLGHGTDGVGLTRVTAEVL